MTAGGLAAARVGDSVRRGLVAVGWVPLLAVGGAVLAAFVLPAKVSDPTHGLGETVFGGASGLLFLGAGAVAHLRRPENRVGLLMVLVGLGWFAEDVRFLSWPPASTLGLLLATASAGITAHLVLAFPTGRLDGPVPRALVGAAYVASLGVTPVGALFLDPLLVSPANTPNLLLIDGHGGVVQVTDRIVDVFGVVVAGGVLVVLARRWLTASGPQRRVLAPVYLTGLVGAAATALGSAVDDPLRWVLLQVFGVVFCLLPLAFLAGVLRVQLGRTTVARLVVGLQRPLTPDELRERLATALGDPSLEIGYWRPETRELVTATGVQLRLPDPTAGRVVTYVDSGGHRVAGLVHDAAVEEDTHVFRAVTAAAGLALDNQRLTAQLRAQLVEVRASRARIVAAGAEERLRMERNLHDGVQQSVVAASIGIRLAADRLGDGADPALRELVDACGDGLDTALAELREIAHGLHPAVLSEQGLVDALRLLAQRAPFPVEVDAEPTPRLPAPVEATAYLVAAEALTNAMKHARAEHIRIAVEQVERTVEVRVSDDGVGGADTAGGSGLLGLADRVRALDGDLTIRSEPGRGTTVTARLPFGGAT